MLTRLYIDNFRCFEKFEWRPGRKQLILGRNGTGKSSFADAVSLILQSAVLGSRVDHWFELGDRTRWLKQREMTFQIEAQLKSGDYAYRLVIEPGVKQSRTRVHHESVRLNNQPLLVFEDGGIAIHSSGGGVSRYRLAQNRSALSTVSPETNSSLVEFQEWLTETSYWHMNPFDMESRAEEDEEVLADTDLANFATWYRHLARRYSRENTAFLRDLQESLDGFVQLQLEDAGENVQILYAEFRREGKSVKVGFRELSDGQRCLICLYAILHFVVAKGGTVIVDEPENFISLREIQPWLIAIDDMVSDSKGQVFLISHHPEIMNQWAPAYGAQFVRDGTGPVRVEKFQGNPEYSLSPGELIARGWERE